ncbi:hypothetical protein FA95DRAFT_1572632 [Auriscalpium vulgare]|uniref:Uncharacterized protein n=1 Tax=Auriscalpium vulgare TaxID=40419 RepID=A0ACB8RSY6_9AGAM|nr:hypothetical protein FA95DRAFT_1572632 [Auriscalpium vulgare]
MSRSMARPRNAFFSPIDDGRADSSCFSEPDFSSLEDFNVSTPTSDMSFEQSYMTDTTGRMLESSMLGPLPQDLRPPRAKIGLLPSHSMPAANPAAAVQPNIGYRPRRLPGLRHTPLTYTPSVNSGTPTPVALPSPHSNSPRLPPPSTVSLHSNSPRLPPPSIVLYETGSSAGDIWFAPPEAWPAGWCPHQCQTPGASTQASHPADLVAAVRRNAPQPEAERRGRSGDCCIEVPSLDVSYRRDTATVVIPRSSSHEWYAVTVGRRVGVTSSSIFDFDRSHEGIRYCYSR